MKDSISIVIPAYNEEESIKIAVRTVQEVVKKVTKDFEIIVVNDGSIDNTGKIINALAKSHSYIKVIHHNKNLGFGKTFSDGIQKSTKSFIAGFPADNDLFPDTFLELLQSKRENTISSTYMLSMKKREVSRKIISHTYTGIINASFGLHLHYYNGYFICPASLLKSIPLKSNGFTLFAEIKVRLIKKGYSIYEVPFTYKPRQFGHSKAVSIPNILEAIRFYPTLLKDIYLGS